MNRPLLPEPCVPGHADPGEVRDFFAAQTARSPPPGREQADIGRSDACPSRAQTIVQLLSSDLVLVHLLTHYIGSFCTRINSTSDFEHQYKELSSTGLIWFYTPEAAAPKALVVDAYV
jgi:hypothetical protein